MPDSRETFFRNATTIASADVIRAYLHPGTAFGSLRPYISATVMMEASRTFIVSHSGREIRAPNDGAAVNLFARVCGEEVGKLQDRNPTRYNEAVSFINGAGLRAAEEFLKSPH